MVKLSEQVFEIEKQVAPLGIVAAESAIELAEKIDEYLVCWANESKEFYRSTFLIRNSCPRFKTGDGKGEIHDTVRGDDLYFIVDVGNYNCTFNLFNKEVPMSPDDHYQDLKRLIQAAGGKAHRINVIMPILYGGRQHKRNYRESLDCAVALQELERMGVKNLVTFDAHDPRVQNAVPLMGFDNVYPTYQVLKALFRNVDNLKIDRDHLMVVSPDEGALGRNKYYASVLNVDLGLFYKRRDYSKMVNGRNPIAAHEYLGASVEGKDIFVSDDLISSGESVLDLAYELKKRKAGRIFASATYALFTEGLDEYNKAYKDGIIDGVLGTNLTYRTEELKKAPWFIEVDISKYIAYIIAALNHDKSISSLLLPHDKIEALLKKYKSK